MTSSPVTVLYNPTAGRGRAARCIDAISTVFARCGLAHRLQSSGAAGDIERQVCRIAESGAERIIVAGGDGSIHEAVNGLMKSGASAALGIVPIGTGNDAAKACAIPLNCEDAAEMLADRLRNGIPVRSIDVGRMNDRYFVNGAGVGFDARVSAIAERNRLPIGDLVYLLAVFRGLVDGVCTPPLVLEYGGRTIEGPLTLASVSNGPWVGGLFPIAPAARNDDGELNLVFADPLSRLGVLLLLPRLLRGTHPGHRAVHEAAVTECRIRAAEPLLSHLDGEIQAPAAEFEIEVLPGALALL